MSATVKPVRKEKLSKWMIIHMTSTSKELAHAATVPAPAGRGLLHDAVARRDEHEGHGDDHVREEHQQKENEHRLGDQADHGEDRAAGDEEVLAVGDLRHFARPAGERGDDLVGVEAVAQPEGERDHLVDGEIGAVELEPEEGEPAVVGHHAGGRRRRRRSRAGP